MKIGKLLLILPAASALLIFTCMAVLAADGMVAGTVTFEMEDGRVEPGNWIRVLLVTRAVDIPKMDQGIQPGTPRYVDAVNSLHTRFYIEIQNQLAAEGYLYASTLTTDEGAFKIPAVAPGDYVVLVKFPDNIRGYKVAWQTPIRVVSGQTVTVDLNRSNLALPTVKR